MMKTKIMTVLAALAVAMMCTGCHSQEDSDNSIIGDISVTEATQDSTTETTTSTSATSVSSSSAAATTVTTTARTTTAPKNAETKSAETSETAVSQSEQERSGHPKNESPVSNEQPEQDVIAIPKEEPVHTEPATEAEQTEAPAVTEGVIEFPFIPIG